MKKFNSFLIVLKEIYNPFIVALAFAPLIVGLIVDASLFDSRNIITNIIWIPIFTVAFILSKKRIVYQIVCLLYFILGLVEISHWIILQGPVTITSFLVISNTNLQEAIDFLNLKATVGLIVLVFYTIFFIFTFKRRPKISKSKFKPYLIGIILLFSAIFILENAINERLIRKGMPHIAKVVFSFIEKINLYEEAMQEIEPKMVQAIPTLPQNQQTFVLIIGESCSRNHMSIYNYSRKTNPKLEKRKDLFVYDNVVSPYSNTLNSVLSMLSESNLERKLNFGKCVDIIDIFYSAGFKTYWLSNQSPIGIWDNLITVFAKKADHYRFVNTTSNSSFEAMFTTSYDSKLFKPFANALSENVAKKFIVLHLMGSHSSYSKRYPTHYDVFNGSNKKEKIIAEYDNSVLYNDFIVDSILNILDENDSLHENSISSAIYLSDHGENVYDEQNKIGHDYSKKLPKANVDIPFIIWLSREYIKSHPLKVNFVRSNSRKPFITDDLFHSIIDLIEIQTPYFEEKRSIFNKRFNDTRQRILEDGKDYDDD
ncbi:MAG: phosphoethanolamine transferase [Bacteroidetes bacterium]|jgi:heptose-I-phosphate ethanolaminephosphotransferase|nr:phosphoethanolamine transferase [Bacteroidota bacterium]MBT6685131.1 phosphoethanolamine transferase [Bacteroidota bacterium]MBT7142042.1 phosphoethanolamine transferase [Bacteroidota bacterium]MBT7493364.1 phosphoethanolamine transferase [Bacteroidota bacterium]